ncbi:DUF2510 domain-containing protein [Frondihabitans peucedani]|uniref:DUF2510 domain-containing protein n=1 Tax=Frondihabitans peucedani TaxID=598626 RepID=A0ABP8E6V6_9MICO
MSTNTPQGSVPPGWYDDPSGAPGSRWWDGTAWTGLTAPPVAAGAQPEAPWAQDRPLLGEGTSVSTVFIWAIVLLPVLALPLSFLYTPSVHVETVRPGGIRTLDPASIYTPAYFVSVGSSLALYGLTVVLAFFDRRELLRRGMVRPFHWAWAFLYTPVYVIGRSVIVHRVAPRRGLWPMWIYIGVVVIVLVLGIVRSTALFHSLSS